MTQANDAGSNIRPLESYRPPRAGSDLPLRQLMAERQLRGAGRFGCYFIADSSRYSDIARAVECSVFERFFGNDAAVMAEAFAAYESHSKFVLVVDRETQQPAGALRIIEHSDRGLKTLNDIAQPPLAIPLATVQDCHRIQDMDRCWDVGTLAVLKQYRGPATGHVISTMLYALFYTQTCKAGIEHVVTVLDDHAYEQLTKILAVPFVPIANSQPFSYLGSRSSRAAYMHVPPALSIVKSYMSKLDENMRALLGPQVISLICCEDLPEIVEVS